MKSLQQIDLIKLSCFLTVCIWPACASDLFTGTDNLRSLSDTEGKFVPHLEKTISSLEDRIQLLKILLTDLKFTHRVPDKEELLLAGHPIHAYNAIKRWQHIQALFSQQPDKRSKYTNVPVKHGCRDSNKDCKNWASVGECSKNSKYMLKFCELSCHVCQLPPTHTMDESLYEIIQNLVQQNNGLLLPDVGDYEGAANALVRLQLTYNISTEDIATGYIMEFQAQRGINPGDFYYIGKAAYKLDEWELALEWLQLATRYVPVGNLNFVNIYNLIADTYTNMENFQKAMEAITQVIRRLNGNMAILENSRCVDKHSQCSQWKSLNECERNPKFMEIMCRFSCKICQKLAAETFPGEYDLANTYHTLKVKISDFQAKNKGEDEHEGEDEDTSDDWQPAYQRLCRGEVGKIKSNVVCRYRPTLPRWNVYKEEIMSFNPRISMIYDVINDTEAKMFIQKARRVMTQATVGHARSVSGIRVSKVGWLNDQDENIKKIAKRVEIITGLKVIGNKQDTENNFISAEPFQTVNYGIGGHYEAHTDFFEHEDKNLAKTDIGKLIEKSGDRIATFLMYLTHVEAGGGTVYPKINVYVPPVKNAAAFWYNSKLSGEYDQLTLHAGCPVLMGEKWVSNKWIREFGNEFTRKCGPTQDAGYS